MDELVKQNGRWYLARDGEYLPLPDDQNAALDELAGGATRLSFDETTGEYVASGAPEQPQPAATQANGAVTMPSWQEQLASPPPDPSLWAPGRPWPPKKAVAGDLPVTDEAKVASVWESWYAKETKRAEQAAVAQREADEQAALEARRANLATTLPNGQPIPQRPPHVPAFAWPILDKDGNPDINAMRNEYEQAATLGFHMDEFSANVAAARTGKRPVDTGKGYFILVDEPQQRRYGSITDLIINEIWPEQGDEAAREAFQRWEAITAERTDPIERAQAMANLFGDMVRYTTVDGIPDYRAAYELMQSFIGLAGEEAPTVQTRAQIVALGQQATQQARAETDALQMSNVERQARGLAPIGGAPTSPNVTLPGGEFDIPGLAATGLAGTPTDLPPGIPAIPQVPNLGQATALSQANDPRYQAAYQQALEAAVARGADAGTAEREAEIAGQRAMPVNVFQGSGVNVDLNARQYDEQGNLVGVGLQHTPAPGPMRDADGYNIQDLNAVEPGQTPTGIGLPPALQAAQDEADRKRRRRENARRFGGFSSMPSIQTIAPIGRRGA